MQEGMLAFKHSKQLLQMKMTLLLHQISTVAACGLILLLCLQPVSSVPTLTKSGEPKSILLTNKSFEFQCTATGTPSELAGAKFTWRGPDDVSIPGNDDKGNITMESGAENVTSILRVSKPPDYPRPPSLKYFMCEVNGIQLSFPVYIVKEKAIPKIHPIQLNRTRHKETVLVKCDASYENENNGIARKFNVNLSWLKDGKLLANKTVEYKTGNQIVSLNHTVTVNDQEDTGIYICQSQLALKDKTDSVTESKNFELRTLLYLNGPKKKAVKAIVGSDFKLRCDVTDVLGYPITYQWRDEDCLIGVGKNCTVQSSQGTRAQLTRLTTILLICMYTFCFLEWL
ncbi:uncharacterized protein LOC114529374 isoform X2 [Dendronephthya gigantea]|uniref:uncharacterized protein LOC114529374 isoform X2 n=1 Tax=Dendronephthya gigantea TaxID=151771 RepID=UPI0010696E95|nr:uncharacterized protein LOC114529374 isoform X2 [Dendronephthya gigantea]